MAEKREMNADFSRVLGLLRQEKGISQRKAAADLGISQALLSHYENGIRDLWPGRVITTMCRRTICWGGATAGTGR